MAGMSFWCWTISKRNDSPTTISILESYAYQEKLTIVCNVISEKFDRTIPRYGYNSNR
jgi:hypothetical protein